MLGVVTIIDNVAACADLVERHASTIAKHTAVCIKRFFIAPVACVWTFNIDCLSTELNIECA